MARTSRPGTRKLKSKFAGGKTIPPEVLKTYLDSGPVVAPHERNMEGRKVHRVREYWLEYEAMEHMHTLQDFSIPVALFEDRMHEVNKNNPRFIPSTITESSQVFFREVLDDNGVTCLKLKLSEKIHYNKPSKNILKRWNLSNGMLYLFYSIIGRDQPPTPHEIMSPFYHQKRVDFIRMVCMVSNLKESTSGNAKRRRRDPSEPILNPKELYIDASDDIDAFIRNLQMFLGAEISGACVKQAVEKGVWDFKTIYSDEEEEDEEEEEEGDARVRTVWMPSTDKVEDWSFENGTLQTFVRACRINRTIIKPVWDSWNHDLGNNSIKWDDLWNEQQRDAEEEAGQGGGSSGTTSETIGEEEEGEKGEEEEERGGKESHEQYETLTPLPAPDPGMEDELYYLDLTNGTFDDGMLPMMFSHHGLPYYTFDHIKPEGHA